MEKVYNELVEELMETVAIIEETQNIDMTKVKIWLSYDYENFKNNAWFLKTIIANYEPMQVIRLWAPNIQLQQEDEIKVNQLLSELLNLV